MPVEVAMQMSRGTPCENKIHVVLKHVSFAKHRFDSSVDAHCDPTRDRGQPLAAGATEVKITYVTSLADWVIAQR